MPTTCLDMIRSSLRLIGQLGPGRGAGPSELVDAMYVLNAMLDQWNTDPLKIFTTRIDVYPLVAGKFSYTYGGPGSDFVISTSAPGPMTLPLVRPTIEQANVILNDVSPVLRQHISIIGDQGWSLIKLQNIPGGAIPTKLYYDGGWPSGVIYLWTAPGKNYQLELYTSQPLSQFAATTDQVVAPSGYLSAMRYNLAVALGLEWQKPASPDVIELARVTLRDIQSLNAETPLMQCDSAVLPGPSGGDFNWLSGEVG
jgi:hypothetical protein